MTSSWTGRKVTQARAIVATWLPAPCGQCGQTVHPDPPGTDPRRSGWVVGHRTARSLRPDLMWSVDNWQPEHRTCSDRSGQAAVIEKARAEGERAALADFPAADDAREPPPLPISPSRRQDEPVEVREGLAWSVEAMRARPWLVEFAVVPADASPPLWMSPVPADAVGSYAEPCFVRAVCPEGAIAWIEATERKRLRWWQRLAITRQLEHRADWSLCHKTIVESAPRRAGKSVRIRGLALWRLAHGPALFGAEEQTVVHTGSDAAICREIQRGAWRWAQGHSWKVTTANGKEAIETPDLLSRWVVRSQNSVYGWTVDFGVVDEGWNVKPDTVSEGLEPTTEGRPSAQLHLTSTAHRRATSLMRGQLLAALTIDDPEVLLLVWAAPAGSDPGDPAVWRAASPHWSEERHRMLSKKYTKALAGEADPELDDPDPMAGFTSQYMNVWRLRKSLVTGRGEGVVDELAWRELAADVPFAVPDSAAIESWFDVGVSLVLGWRVGERVVVSATGYDDLAGAVAALRASEYRGAVTIGSSMAADPAVKGLAARPGEGRVGAAAAALRGFLREDVVRHDGREHLASQVLALRTVAGADGPRMASSERADAVKAAVWAIGAARAGGSTIMAMVLPSSATRG